MKTAVVTGGGRGIGRAVCLALAKGGTNLVVNYKSDAAAANETVAACQKMGAQAIAVCGDVGVKADCEAIAAAAINAYGAIDILVNNAGVTRDNLLLRMTEEEWTTVLDTNLRGVFFMTQAAVRHMLCTRYGRIVNITSVVGLSGNAGQTNYAAAKAGIVGFTKSAAREFALKGITVNAVAPGFICTDMTAALSDAHREKMQAQIPQNRLGKAEEVAHAVAFLASEEAAYITGQVLSVDGGMTMR